MRPSKRRSLPRSIRRSVLTCAGCRIPEPLVYSVREAAHVLRTSTTTVRRLVDEGVLPIVPHMGQRIVIPRAAVARLVEGNPAHTSVDTETGWLRKVEA